MSRVASSWWLVASVKEVLGARGAMNRFGSMVLVFLLFACGGASAGDLKTETAAATETSAQRGFRLLTTKPYLPPDFDEEVFNELWRAWEEPLHSQAENASPDERRAMAFA